MCNEAATLVDRIFPSAPIRQWVMSLPFELRALAGTKTDVLAAMERIFAEETGRMTTRLAGIDGAQTGSIGCPQRFGSSMNLHVPMHTLGLDGVFEKIEGGVRFHEAPPPSKENVGEVARRVRDRALRWLRRRGYLDERAAEERSNETATPSAIEACTQLALAGGAFLARPFELEENHDADKPSARPRARPPSRARPRAARGRLRAPRAPRGSPPPAGRSSPQALEQLVRASLGAIADAGLTPTTVAIAAASSRPPSSAEAPAAAGVALGTVSTWPARMATADRGSMPASMLAPREDGTGGCYEPPHGSSERVAELSETMAVSHRPPRRPSTGAAGRFPTVALSCGSMPPSAPGGEALQLGVVGMGVERRGGDRELVVEAAPLGVGLLGHGCSCQRL
jgi:hypothetical protein